MVSFSLPGPRVVGIVGEDQGSCVRPVSAEQLSRRAPTCAQARVSAQFGADVADGTAKRREDLVIRHCKPLVGVQLLGGVLGNPPARGYQLLTGWTARTDPHQFGDIDIQSVLAPATA